MLHNSHPEALFKTEEGKNSLFSIAQGNSNSGFIGLMPMRHEEQPEERYVSKPADEDDPDEGIAFWRDVDAAYVMCLRTIKQGKDFGDSRTGKEWTGM